FRLLKFSHLVEAPPPRHHRLGVVRHVGHSKIEIRKGRGPLTFGHQREASEQEAGRIGGVVLDLLTKLWDRCIVLMKRVENQASVKMTQWGLRIKSKHPVELCECLDTPAEVVECPPQVQMSFDVLVRQLRCLAKMRFCFLVLGLIQLRHAEEEVSA